MLTLTNIQKTFGIGTVNEKAALRGIDLHLDAGDFVTVLGSNGAGKSTLFGAIGFRHRCAGRPGHYPPAGLQAQQGHWQALSGPAPGHRSQHDH